MKNIISRLFEGEIFPAETAVPVNSEYRSVIDKMSKTIAGLQETLTTEQNNKLEYIMDVNAKIATMESKAYYAEGVRFGVLRCRMMEESGSFSSLDEYKMARGIAWLYNESGKSRSEVIAEFAKRENCSEETAAKYLTLARANRSQVSFYATTQDEDGRKPARM